MIGNSVLIFKLSIAILFLLLYYFGNLDPENMKLSLNISILTKFHQSFMKTSEEIKINFFANNYRFIKELGQSF